MRCEKCGSECERGMRLTFRLVHVSGRSAWYDCKTLGVAGSLGLPRSDDAPAEELTVYVEGV